MAAPERQSQLRFTRVDIEAYRGLSALILDGLTRFNLVVGATNVGKSSLLEAIALLAQPSNLASWLIASRADWSLAAASAVRDMFPSSMAMEISGTFAQGATRRLRGRFEATTERFGVFDGSNERPPSHLVQVDVDGDISWRFPINVYLSSLSSGTLADSKPPATLLSHTAETMAGLAIVALSAAVDRGRKGLVLAALRLFDRDVEDVNVSVSEGAQRVVVQHARRGAADLRSFGDGFRAAFRIATALGGLEGGVLLVDELLSSLHVGALCGVVAWLVAAARELDVQIIATTHSLDLVDAFVEGLAATPDELAVYRLVRHPGGARASRLDGDAVRVAREIVGEDLR